MTIRVIPERNQHVEVFTFPDGQPHVRYTGPTKAEVDLIQPIRNPHDFVVFLLTLDALHRGRCRLGTLYVPYMMGARSDRVMQPGDSVCNVLVLYTIQKAGFAHIKFLDLHNEDTIWAMKEATNIIPYKTLLKEVVPPEIIIRPDDGAHSRALAASHFFRGLPIVDCQKNRDSAGRITLEMSEKDRAACKDKICLIADDICDGGGTFLAIADLIEPRYISLVVTHGIFSKGLDILKKKFDRIVTTDSFCKEPTQDKLIVVSHISSME